MCKINLNFLLFHYIFVWDVILAEELEFHWRLKLRLYIEKKDSTYHHYNKVDHYKVNRLSSKQHSLVCIQHDLSRILEAEKKEGYSSGNCKIQH